MIQDPAEGVAADFAFANMLVTIEMRTKSALRIIGMNNKNALKADGC